jgi:hypothetical protein
MHKLSILCAAATLGAVVFVSTEASARGGFHGGGHHGGCITEGIMAAGTAAAIIMVAGTAAATAMGVGADGFLAPMAGIGSGVAGKPSNGGEFFQFERFLSSPQFQVTRERSPFAKASGLARTGQAARPTPGTRGL